MEWFPIPGFPNYSINELGQVKSKHRIIKNCPDSNGYCLVKICRTENGKPKHVSKYIHRLLAETFISNPLNLKTVNHINGIKTDNRLENLEWMSIKNNIRHAKELGLTAKGETSGNAKLKNENVREVLSGCAHAKDLAKKFNVSVVTIYDIRKRKTWRHIAA